MKRLLSLILTLCSFQLLLPANAGPQNEDANKPKTVTLSAETKQKLISKRREREDGNSEDRDSSSKQEENISSNDSCDNKGPKQASSSQLPLTSSNTPGNIAESFAIAHPAGDPLKKEFSEKQTASWTPAKEAAYQAPMKDLELIKVSPPEVNPEKGQVFNITLNFTPKSNIQETISAGENNSAVVHEPAKESAKTGEAVEYRSLEVTKEESSNNSSTQMRSRPVSQISNFAQQSIQLQRKKLSIYTILSSGDISAANHETRIKENKNKLDKAQEDSTNESLVQLLVLLKDNKTKQAELKANILDKQTLARFLDNYISEQFSSSNPTREELYHLPQSILNIYEQRAWAKDDLQKLQDEADLISGLILLRERVIYEKKEQEIHEFTQKNGDLQNKNPVTGQILLTRENAYLQELLENSDKALADSQERQKANRTEDAKLAEQQQSWGNTFNFLSGEWQSTLRQKRAELEKEYLAERLIEMQNKLDKEMCPRKIEINKQIISNSLPAQDQVTVEKLAQYAHLSEFQLDHIHLTAAEVKAKIHECAKIKKDVQEKLPKLEENEEKRTNKLKNIAEDKASLVRKLNPFGTWNSTLNKKTEKANAKYGDNESILAELKQKLATAIREEVEFTELFRIKTREEEKAKQIAVQQTQGLIIHSYVELALTNNPGKREEILADYERFNTFPADQQEAAALKLIDAFVKTATQHGEDLTKIVRWQSPLLNDIFDSSARLFSSPDLSPEESRFHAQEIAEGIKLAFYDFAEEKQNLGKKCISVGRDLVNDPKKGLERILKKFIRTRNENNENFMKRLSMSPEERAAIQAYIQSLSVKDRTRLYTKQFLHAAEELGLQVGAYSASRAVFNPKQIMHPEAAEASAAEIATQKLLEKKSDFTLIEVDGVWKLVEEASAVSAQVATTKIGSFDITSVKSKNFLKHHSLEYLNSLAQGYSPDIVKNVVQLLESQATTVLELAKHPEGHKLVPTLQKIFITPEKAFELASKFDNRILKSELAIYAPHLADKPLTFDYNHLFSPAIRIKAGEIIITGYHHDAQNILEGCEHFTMQPFRTKELPEGFYQISVGPLNSDPKSTVCFPKEWTQEKVMSKIEESIRNGTVKRQKDGKIAIIGYISEGIRIRSIIDSKTGSITSAFPDIY